MAKRFLTDEDKTELSSSIKSAQDNSAEAIRIAREISENIGEGSMTEIATFYDASTNMSADNLTVGVAIVPISETVNTELFALFGGTFAYVMTMFKTAKDSAMQRAQIALPYDGEGGVVSRFYDGSSWSEWHKGGIGEDEVNALLANYLPLDGRVPMTGKLKINRRTSPSIDLNRTNSDGTIRDSVSIEHNNTWADIAFTSDSPEFETGLRFNTNEVSLDNRVNARIDGVYYPLFGEHNTDLLKNYVLPLDGSVPMSKSLDIVQKARPGVTLYEGETKDTATDRVQFRQLTGNLQLSHKVISTGNETSLFISATEGNVPIRLSVGNSTKALFGEHNVTSGTTDIGAGSAMTSLIHLVYEE